VWQLRFLVGKGLTLMTVLHDFLSKRIAMGNSKCVLYILINMCVIYTNQTIEDCNE
jgi:hypothetical protein